MSTGAGQRTMQELKQYTLALGGLSRKEGWVYDSNGFALINSRCTLRVGAFGSHTREWTNLNHLADGLSKLHMEALCRETNLDISF